MTSATRSARRAAGELAAQLRQAQPEQVHHGDLAGERLRGGDPDLEAGAREEHAVGLARGLRAHHVGDREHAGAALAGETIAASVSAVSPDCEMPSTRSPGPTTGLR